MPEKVDLPNLTSFVQVYNRTNKILRLLEEDCMKVWKITGIQAIVLNSILQGIDRPNEISKKLESTSQTMTGVIDRLERSGFIERKRDIKDRRGVRLIPTQTCFDMVGSPTRFAKKLESLITKAACEADH